MDPYVGIAVDVTFATDQPDVEAKRIGDAELGKGPVLHRGANFNPLLVKLTEKAARVAKIKTQMQAIPGGSGTDANAMQLTRAGVAAALISIPTRYMHSPVEVIHLSDAENTAKLIAKIIENLTGREDFTP